MNQSGGEIESGSDGVDQDIRSDSGLWFQWFKLASSMVPVIDGSTIENDRWSRSTAGAAFKRQEVF